jgi:hypothetical protein
VLAHEGSYADPPYALGYVENIVSAEPDVSIALPEPPVVTQPSAASDNVDANTRYQWSGTAPVFRLEVTSQTGCDALYVVTSHTEVGLPVAPRGGYRLPSATQFSWLVSTAGGERSVDEAAGVAGSDGPFRMGVVHGSERAPGSLALSERRTFTTAR